jgi:hypothetical protein
MNSEERVGLQDYAYELVDNITRGDYRLVDVNNVSEINAVLNNDTLMDFILLGLQDHYGEGTEAEARFNEFIRYNTAIINNIENENITRRIDNIIINDNQNNMRPPTPPTPKITEPEPIEIPQEVIDRIPQEVLNVITCPITGEIMRNPVVNSVGQTYDKNSIQQWISRGNRTDPNTRQQITTTLIPNFSIKSLINTYIPQLGGKRKYTKKNRKYKKSKKTKTNKKTKNMKKIKKMKKMKKNKTVKQKKVLKNRKHNKKTKSKRK